MFPNNLPDFPYIKALYRRNNFGQPCVWFVTPNTTHSIIVYHGIIGKTISKEIINLNRLASAEVKSRINAKRKAGYKYLNELKDNVELPVEGELLNYLNSYLPDYRTTEDGSLLPMLAKAYDNTNNRLFKKVDYYIGQWKINGLRCFISAKVNTNNMFKPYSLDFQSREGEHWKTLTTLEEYLLSILDRDLLAKMIDEHYVLDGEIYLPGYKINKIDHFVKNPNCKENKLLQFWCYDIAIDDTIQSKRIEYLDSVMGNYQKFFSTKEQHLNNTERFILLPTYNIINGEGAVTCRDCFINNGFEGIILRNPNMDYKYGSRGLHMIKFKDSSDGKFKIINIKPEGVKRPDIPIFECQNDINDAIFECHVGGNLDYQRSILRNKNLYIGKFMYVEYGERSGVNEVPFHIKETYIIK